MSGAGERYGKASTPTTMQQRQTNQRVIMGFKRQTGARQKENSPVKEHLSREGGEGREGRRTYCHPCLWQNFGYFVSFARLMILLVLAFTASSTRSETSGRAT